MAKPHLLLGILLAASPALAQHDPARHGGGHRTGAEPYAGLETREIKALSPAEVGDLRAGRGMGLALAAELNAYPGPMHALENADALRLSPAQRGELERLMAGMRSDAVAAGERLIEAERSLDRLFEERRATPQAVSEAAARAGAAAAAVRAVHLATHIATRALLTEEQVARYGELRGYRRPG